MVPEKQEFQAIVLAGGRGSRMPELTAQIPKALVPVANQPLIFYPLQWLNTAGVDEAIILCIDSQKNEIQQAVSTNFSVNHRIRITYAVIPADKPDFDTADALRSIAGRIKRDFLVVSCDFISNLPLGRMLDLFRTHDASMVACFVPNIAVGSDSATVNIAGPKTKRQPEKEILMYDEKSMRLVRSFAEAELDEDGMQLSWKIFERFPCIRTRSTLCDARVYIFKRWIIDFVNHDDSKQSLSSLTDDLKPKLLRRQFQAFGKLPTELLASNWPPPVNKPAGRSSSSSSATAGIISSSSHQQQSPVMYLPNIHNHMNRARQHAFLTQQSMMLPPASMSKLPAYRASSRRKPAKPDILTLVDYSPEELLIQSLSINNSSETSGLSRLVRESDVVEAVKCYAYLVENNNVDEGGIFAYRVNNLQTYCEVNRLHTKLRAAFAQVAANALPAAHVPRTSASSGGGGGARERATSSTSDSQSASVDHSSIDSGAVFSGGGGSAAVLKQTMSTDNNNKPQWGNDSLVGEKTTIGDKAVIKKSVIGRSCTIGEKVVLGNCIVMDSVVVEKGSILQNCILCSEARVADRCELKDCIVGFGLEVKSGAKVANETLLSAADDEDDENDD